MNLKKFLVFLCLYSFHLKALEFDKKAPQNFCSERETIAERQGSSENENYGVKPTQSKRELSSGRSIFPTLIWTREGSLQARAGYFGFASSWPRKIYGNGAPDFEIEGNVKIAPCAFFWSNLNYVWKEGNSTKFSDHTHLDLATLSTGFNLAVPIHRSSTLFCFGIGISGACVHTSDHNPHLPGNTTRFGVGFVAKTGVFIPCTTHFFLNPFFDYYYQPIHARNSGVHSSVDMGGFRTGLGIGYYFQSSSKKSTPGHKEGFFWRK